MSKTTCGEKKDSKDRQVVGCVREGGAGYRMRSDTHEAEDDAYTVEYTKDSPGMGKLASM